MYVPFPLFLLTWISMKLKGEGKKKYDRRLESHLKVSNFRKKKIKINNDCFSHHCARD